MLYCQDLTKVYGKKKVVDNLSFKVQEGEIFGLIGPNGAGKTTTIKMLLGLTRPTGGQIVLNLDTRVGYSPETPYFHGFLTAKEVLYFYGRLERLAKSFLQTKIPLILNKVGLQYYDETKISQYSKGMIQRLAVAQALLNSPELLILDEPAAGLDAEGRIEILEMIKDFKSEGKTVIINSHILNDVEKIADRGIILKEGKLIREWNFNQASVTLKIICQYNEDILVALKPVVQKVVPEDGGIIVEVADPEVVPIIARIIVMGRGKLYRIQETKNLEEIFLQSLGGVGK